MQARTPSSSGATVTVPFTAICLGLLLAGCDTTEPDLGSEPVRNEAFTGAIFPADNWWNRDISQAPVDPASAALIDWICDRSGPSEPCDADLHPDFGGHPYGIPYIGVSEDQPLEAVDFVLYGDESDAGAPGRPEGYPIPPIAHSDEGWIEGGEAGGGDSGDRHLLIVDRDRWLLYELWATRWNGSGWEAGSGAIFDLSTNERRPEGWTSADAAGLAVLPGLVKYHEVEADRIDHALRVTVRATNGHVWPASHTAGSTTGAPPLGTRLRLRADFDTSGYTADVVRIFEAMKRYGLIIADNGSDMFVQGTMDERWDNDVLNPAFHSVLASDFEVIELGWR